MGQVSINSDNYALAAVSTEAPYEGARERLDNLSTLLVLGDILLRSIRTGKAQDDFKKFVFYGKENHLAGAEDEPKTQDQQDLYTRLTSDPRVLRLLHVAIGLQTEAAELQEALANYLFMNKAIDWTNIQEELGDSLWYCGVGSDVCGLSLTQIAQQNIDKLAKRYPDKFTEFAANNRDLAGEYEVLKGSGALSNLGFAVRQASYALDSLGDV